jgi:hypothetical protein
MLAAFLLRRRSFINEYSTGIKNNVIKVDDTSPPITVRPMGCIIVADLPGKKAIGISPRALLDTLDYDGGVPHAVIAKTVKGKGVSFMENLPEWHHRIPTEDECKKALQELIP